MEFKQFLACLVVGFAIINAHHADAQGQTWQEYYDNVKSVEAVSDVQRPFEIEWIDERRFQENTIPLRHLREATTNALGYSQDPAGLKPVVIELSVDYLGFYTTRGGRWSGKALLSLEFPPTAQGLVPGPAPIAQDLLFDKGDLTPKRLNMWSAAVVDAAKQRIVEEVEAVADHYGADLRVVTSFGKAQLHPAEAEGMIRERAVLDALRRGVGSAWGVQVSSVSSTINLGEIQIETRSREKGLVRHFEILEEYTKQTADDHLCVMVRAIIGRPDFRGLP